MKKRDWEEEEYREFQIYKNVIAFYEKMAFMDLWSWLMDNSYLLSMFGNQIERLFVSTHYYSIYKNKNAKHFFVNPKHALIPIPIPSTAPSKTPHKVHPPARLLVKSIQQTSMGWDPSTCTCLVSKITK